MSVLNRINLKLLQTFLLVAEHSSFRQAAEVTHRSQSAVSTQIRQLEDQLGLQLFRRTTRRVRLTDAGEHLQASARRALLEVETGLRRLQEMADIRQGRIAMSCSPTIAATRLPSILTAFEKDYPSVTVLVREQASADLFETVRRGESDFGVGPVTVADDFSFQPILSDPLYAVVPRTLLPAKRRTIELEELAEMPILILDHANALRALLEEKMLERRLTLRTRHQFGQALTLFAMAAAGLGAGIVPRVVLPEVNDPRVQMLRITPALYRQIAIITRRGQELSPAAARLAQLIGAMIDADAGTGTPAAASPAGQARDRMRSAP